MASASGRPSLVIASAMKALSRSKVTVIKSVLAAGKRLEGDDGVGVLDAGNHLHLLVDEMADVGLVIDIELDQQVVMTGGGIDLRGDLGLRERIGYRIGLPELAFELDEKGNHCCRLRNCWCQYSVFKRSGYRFAQGKRVKIRRPKMGRQ